jgi:hypothetical protein
VATMAARMPQERNRNKLLGPDSHKRERALRCPACHLFRVGSSGPA